MDHVVVSTIEHDVFMMRQYKLVPVLHLLSRTLGETGYNDIKRFLRTDSMDDVVNAVMYLIRMGAVVSNGVTGGVSITKYGTILMAIDDNEIQLSEVEK